MSKPKNKGKGKNPKEQEKKQLTPHDLFFRAMFQMLFEVRVLMEAAFPEEILAEIDLSQLQLDNTTYVDEELQPSYSDISYLAHLRSRKALRINVLVEHKGQTPKPIWPEQVQIVTYKVGIWRKDFLNKRKPTFVFAVLLHHGKRKYQYKKFEECFEGLPESWKTHVDDIKFFVLDLNKWTDEKILEKMGGYIIGSALLALKHAHEPKYFEQNLSKLFNFDWQNYPPEILARFIKTLFFYLEKVTKMKTKEIIQKSNGVPRELTDMMSITIESVYSEGKAEGKAEGVEEKTKSFVISMLQNCPDFSDEKIALIAAVPLAFVAKVKAELSAPKVVKVVRARTAKPLNGTRNGRKKQ